MKKFLRLTRLFVCLCAMLSSTSAFAGAQWIGNSYINVNTTWYQGSGNEAWATGGAFNGHEFGTISSIAIGGQLQIGDDGADWKSGEGDWMSYAIYSGETQEMTGAIHLSYDSYGYGAYNNNMRFQSGGSNFSASDIDISNLPEGSTYTLKVWFGPIDGKYENSLNSATEYTATFIKGIDISDATVTGINVSYDWSGEIIHPVPVVTLNNNVLDPSTDYDVTYSEGCTNGGDYTVTITGKGNYAGTKVVNFSILVPIGYYLVGTINGWGLNKNFKLAQNTNNTDEYYIRNVVLSATDELKVVRTDDGKTKNEYFPTGDNYKPGKSTWDIYFRPSGGGGDGWHEGTLYASPQSSIDVALAPTGYGTYYNGQCEVTLPTGVVAYIVTDATHTTPTYLEIANGDDATNTIPAGTAVLLYSATVKAGGVAANITLTLTPSSANGNYTNLLYGSDTGTTTSGGKYYYKLTYGNNNKPFGWYWGADNGDQFYSPAHKAWLALPALPSGTARAFFSLPGDDFTGIATIENRQQNADNVWYDLNGRRINAPTTKGIYVKDGRKFVIK